VPVDEILSELKTALGEGLEADYITIGGSGEPTLHSGLGRLIAGIKKLTSIPVAILTNGTLFYLPEVRENCAEADVILPSLDAGDQRTFEKINRPFKHITFERLVDGLCALRRRYRGQIWLEIFFIERFNTDNAEVAKLTEAIHRICPDKVHLNTAIRPTAEQDVEKVPPEKLAEIARQLGPKCEVIADFVSSHCGKSTDNIIQTLLSMLKRRPCTLDDVCSALGLVPNEAIKHLAGLKKQGAIQSENKSGKIFFTAS
jgi:wyosine [tRNA(Phe)-imidazoG37] synthetase (radical SAM superfamily)